MVLDRLHCPLLSYPSISSSPPIDHEVNMVSEDKAHSATVLGESKITLAGVRDGTRIVDHWEWTRTRGRRRVSSLLRDCCGASTWPTSSQIIIMKERRWTLCRHHIADASITS
jgi:hypothetical protein